MSSLDVPLVCPVLVGRERETADLVGLCDGVASGEGRLVLVSGEAGIGKSRLLRTVAGARADEGWRVLEAHCYEQDRGLPHALILDLVQRTAAQGASAATVLAPAASALAHLLPEIRELLPTAERLEPLEPEQERRRLFTAFVNVLHRACERGPCLLLLEDLHWADQASLDLLAFVSRRLTGLPLLVLATYRSDEVTPGLRQLLAALDRERLAAELPLRRLTLSEVDVMVRATLGGAGPVHAPLLHALYQRTEGNPFAIEEMLRASVPWATDGPPDVGRVMEAQIPRSIQEAVQRRLGEVSPEAWELVCRAAVIGDRFDLPVLEAVAPDRGSVPARLRELAAQHLLVEAGDEGFRFRHALTREAVLRQLVASERRALHEQVAGALERLHAADPQRAAGDLAYHLAEAGRWDRVAPYARTAGLSALQLSAPHSAVAHFTRAFEAAKRLGHHPSPELLTWRARAYEAIGAFDAARADLETAIEVAEAGGELVNLVDALLELGLLWAARDYAEARSHLVRAVEIARLCGETSVLARALNRLGNWYSNDGRYRESRAYLDESLTRMREAGDPVGIAETVDLLGMTCLQAGRFDESLAFLREAAERFEALQDARALASPLAAIPVLSGTYQTSMLRPALTLKDAAALGERAVAVARSAGSQSALAFALWQLAFCLGPQGQQARALELASEALRVAESIEHRQWALAARCVLGAIAIDLLAPERALPHLEPALEEAAALHSHIWRHQTSVLLVAAFLEQGRPDEATAVLARGREANDPSSETLAAYWYPVAEAELALACGEPDRALTLAEALPAERHGIRLRRVRGRALAALGRNEEALAALRAASEEAQAQGDHSHHWRLQCDLAHVLLAVDHPAARACARAALGEIDAVAKTLRDDELRELYLARAALLLPAALRQRTGADGGSPLSARELEVARFVARGLTNRAIADELVVSVRTVETHVANALSKLGHTSRTQLAVWIAEHETDAEAESLST